MVEGARLESVCTLTRTEGSNPSLSAKILKAVSFRGGFFMPLIYGGVTTICLLECKDLSE